MKFCLFMLLSLLTQTIMAEEQKVLTWNVFMIHKPINWTKQIRRAKVIGKTLSNTNYDVIFMQEIFMEDSRRIISKALKKNYPHTARPEWVKLFSLFDSGLMVLSRHPIKVVDEVVFNECAKTDCFASKGALMVEVSFPNGKKAQFVNTHLQAWNTPQTLEVRKIQLLQIKDMMDKNKTHGVPQILIGDLNINGRLPEEFQTSLSMMQMNASPLLGDLQITNGFKVPCYKIPGSEDGGEWLDHFWYQQDHDMQVLGSTVKEMKGMIKKEECPLSDHHAVETKFVL